MIRSTVFRVALFSFLAASFAFAEEDVVSVKSPDGRIEFRLLDGPPNLYTQVPHLAYQVDFNGKRLIDTSYLGFEIANQLPLGQKLGVMDVAREAVDRDGDRYNEVVADYLQNGSLGRRMTMEVRAFNEGVAFRYVVPTTAQLPSMQIEAEMTQFAFAKDGESYPLLLRDFQSGYADQYSRVTLSGVHPESLIGLPFLVEQPSVGWVAVAEADIDDYAGMYLRHDDGRTMKATLSPRVDGSGLAVNAKTPMVTPWRVILISERPEKLIESNIVASLNAPTKIKDASWIRPGKALRDSSNSMEGVKRTIDFAADAGLEYVLVGDAWEKMDVPAILTYAQQKKTGIWLTAEFRAVEAKSDEWFPQFEKWGVRGLVIPGLNRDDQSMVAFYHQIAAKAADHHLMLDLHNAYKPDGLSRTFPNVLTRDAAMGAEFSKWGARVTPEHDVMLAFSRMLAGPLDYGVGNFNNSTREAFEARENRPMKLGTQAHELALFVVFESPLQILAGDPESYKGTPDFEFVKKVPVTWEEARGLAGEVGQYIAVARRHNAEWYLGAITNWSARDLDVPLSFLGSGAYVAEIYADAKPVEQRLVTASVSLHLKLTSGGGAVVRFAPAN
jgi:alpha-glucosidase